MTDQVTFRHIGHFDIWTLGPVNLGTWTLERADPRTFGPLELLIFGPPATSFTELIYQKTIFFNLLCNSTSKVAFW